MTDAERHLQARLEQLEWWGSVGSAKVPEGGSTAAVAASTIVESNELCGQPLENLLPGLQDLEVGAPSDFLKTVRAFNVLTQQSKNTWTDLATFSAIDLKFWPNAGRKTVKEIVRGAIRAWAQSPASSHRTSSGPGSISTSPVNQRGIDTVLSGSYRELRDLGSAVYRKGASTLGDVARLVASGQLEGDFQDRLDSIRLDQILGLHAANDATWDRLLEFGDVEMAILRGRVFPVDGKRTLDNLGSDLGITRERVRQIEGRVRKLVESRLFKQEDFAPIQHAASRVRIQVGTVATEEALSSALARQVPDEKIDAPTRRAVLRELAGPYNSSKGFWQIDETLAGIEASVLEFGDEPISEEAIDRILVSSGVSLASQSAVLSELPLYRFQGNYLVWNGGLQDKAFRILKAKGEAMTREDIHSAMDPEKVNFRSMVNAIGTDERFRRLGPDLYGLVEWGGDEYSGISNAIERVIEKRGGRADIEEVVRVLVASHGVSAQSVRSYASPPRFMRVGSGEVVIAPEDAERPNVEIVPPEFDRDLVVCHGSWTVRFVVDHDLLRGSGRPTRKAIAQAAGVRPGEKREISLANGVAVINWSRTQPAFGSILALAKSLGCEEGDVLFVPLTDGGGAFAVPKRTVQEATGLRRVSLEVGVDSQNEAVGSIAVAIGLDSTVSLAEVRTRLRARQQDELARCLPAERSNDDDQLEELMELGG